MAHHSLSSMMLRIEEIPEIFDDLTPVPQNDGPEPVCAIQYPTSFILAYDYLRACWNSGEKSERSFKLSATCLKLNPANYTVWHYRRSCMEALGYVTEDPIDDSSQSAEDVAKNQAKIREELTLASQLGGDNPKNYQIWYHRRALLEAFHQKTKRRKTGAESETKSEPEPLPEPDGGLSPSLLETVFLDLELAYIARVLEVDSKNYHAWSHRQWLILTINNPIIWEREMEYVKQLIQKDPRNNSAWNHRWFAVHRAVKDVPLTIEICRQEADFALMGARLDPYNESPFRYLIGLLREQQQRHEKLSHNHSIVTTLSTEFYEAVEAMRSILEDAKRDPKACVNWTSARIDLLEAIFTSEALTKASTLARDMADKYDTIRRKYWRLRVRQLEEKKSYITA